MDTKQSDAAASCGGVRGVCLFGRGAWANLAAVGLTVAAIALDAFRRASRPEEKKWRRRWARELDILGTG